VASIILIQLSNILYAAQSGDMQLGA
jgi:hypothetical protein